MRRDRLGELLRRSAQQLDLGSRGLERRPGPLGGSGNLGLGRRQPAPGLGDLAGEIGSAAGEIRDAVADLRAVAGAPDEHLEQAERGQHADGHDRRFHGVEGKEPVEHAADRPGAEQEKKSEEDCTHGWPAPPRRDRPLIPLFIREAGLLQCP